MTTKIKAATSTSGAVFDPSVGDGVVEIWTGNNPASQVLAASFAADGTPTFAKARGGVAQVQTFTTGAVATGTTTIPFDDTIPQITEGDQYLSLAITPVNAGSTLEVDVQLQLGHSVANNLILALFRDSGVNAVAVSTAPNAAGGSAIYTLRYLVAAGSTSATTFTVRAGNSSAGTTTVNGLGGARYMGGVYTSRITIKEYLP